MDSGFAVMCPYGIDAKDTAGREGWTTIKCASKRAYGCGKRGNSAVQYLDLLLHHGDLENLSSSLSLRAGDKVFSWIDKEIAAKGGMRAVKEGQEDPYFRSKVEIVDKGLIVVSLSFSQYGGFDYYLVFDSIDRSLSMIPYIGDWPTFYTHTPCPLPLRRDDGGYSLVLFGSEFRGLGREEEKKNYLIWQWSPSLAGSAGGRSDPWQTKELRFPAELNRHFYPDVLFSSNGLAFWTDLALGALCCDCSTVLAPAANPVVFTFIGLPPGYQHDRDECRLPVQVYRTMGCVGGSIRFVCIDEPEDRYDGGGTRVKVWTLRLSRRKWKIHSDIRLKSLFKDAKFKEAGLPKTLPMWPMLREHEGATLYFILAQKTQTRDVPDEKLYICRIDMPTKSLLQSKLLTHSSLIQGPVIFPCDFLEDLLDPLPSTPEHDLDGRLTKRSRIGQKVQAFKPSSSFSVLIQGFDPSLPVEQLRSSLEEHFSKCGKVTGVSVNPIEGKAYVSFLDVSSVTKAECLGGSDLGGYNLYVAEADIENRFGGSGGRFC